MIATDPMFDPMQPPKPKRRYASALGDPGFSRGPQPPGGGGGGGIGTPLPPGSGPGFSRGPGQPGGAGGSGIGSPPSGGTLAPPGVPGLPVGAFPSLPIGALPDDGQTRPGRILPGGGMGGGGFASLTGLDKAGTTPPRDYGTATGSGIASPTTPGTIGGGLPIGAYPMGPGGGGFASLAGLDKAGTTPPRDYGVGGGAGIGSPVNPGGGIGSLPPGMPGSPIGGLPDTGRNAPGFIPRPSPRGVGDGFGSMAQRDPNDPEAPPPEDPEVFDPTQRSDNGGINGGGPQRPDQAPQAQGVGHDGTYNGKNREQYRDDWMSAGVRDIAGLKAWLAANGGDLLSDNGTVRTPYGETLDMLIGARTGNGQAGWTEVGGGGAGGGGIGGGPAGGGSLGGNGTDFQSQIRAMLLEQLKKAGQPVDLNDPGLQAELSTQSNALERTRRDRRAASAERAAMQGLLNGGQSAGSFDADVASGFEDKANNQSQVISGIYGRELTAKRGQMQNLLNMALQSGDAESARALTWQMAQMDAELKRLGLSQNQSQWNDSFGLSAGQFEYAKARDKALYGLRG